MTTLPKIFLREKLLFCGLFLTFVFRFISTQVIPLDSDEVVWSIMADEMTHLRQFFLFFATQNYAGALESYIIIPFQALFGFRLWVLRINTIIWPVLTAVMVYHFVAKFSSKKWGFLAIVLYNLTALENFLVHSKAWANYTFIEFLSLFSFYLLCEWFGSKKARYLLGLGLLTFVSFISNMQFIFTIIIVLGFQLLYAFREMIKKKSFSFLDISILTVASFIYYLFAKKRMIFNPLETLRGKMGFVINDDMIRRFDVSVIVVIGVFLPIFALWSIVRRKNKKINNLKAFLITSVFFFSAFAVYAHFDSFSRVSSGSLDLINSSKFLVSTAFPGYLGRFWPFFISPVFFGLIVALIKITKGQKLELWDFSLLAGFLFPVLFVLSSAPGLSGSIRYLISWWPDVIISTVFFSNFLWKRNRIVRLLPILLLLLWSVFQIGDIKRTTVGYNKERQIQLEYNRRVAGEIAKADAKYCEGDYWKVGPLMFDSGFKFICWADKKETKADYLDFYKERLDPVQRVYQVR